VASKSVGQRSILRSSLSAHIAESAPKFSLCRCRLYCLSLLTNDKKESPETASSRRFTAICCSFYCSAFPLSLSLARAECVCIATECCMFQLNFNFFDFHRDFSLDDDDDDAVVVDDASGGMFYG
jgi:hypothetical protein